MATINFKIDLDHWGIKEDKIALMEQYLMTGYQNGLDRLIENTKIKLMENMQRYGLGASNYADSVTIEKDGLDGLIIHALDHMLYVEFGTGIVGAGKGHHKPDLSEEFEGWDIHGHGQEGWVYHKDGEFYWTQGQEARPVMYDTWLYVRQAFHATISHAIEKELARLGG